MESCIYCHGFGYSADTMRSMSIQDSVDAIPTLPCPACGANPYPRPEYYEDVPLAEENREVAVMISPPSTDIDATTKRFLNWFFGILVVVLVLSFLFYKYDQRQQSRINNLQQQIEQYQLQVPGNSGSGTTPLYSAPGNTNPPSQYGPPTQQSSGAGFYPFVPDPAQQQRVIDCLAFNEDMPATSPYRKDCSNP